MQQLEVLLKHVFGGTSPRRARSLLSSTVYVGPQGQVRFLLVCTQHVDATMVESLVMVRTNSKISLYIIVET